MTLTMTPASRDRKIDALREAVAVLETMPVVTPCAECGYFESYITDQDALKKIPLRAEKVGDWKKVQ